MKPFASARAYRDHFRPLLLLELREDLRKGYDERRRDELSARLTLEAPPPVRLRELPAAAGPSRLSSQAEASRSGKLVYEIVVELTAGGLMDLGEMDVVLVGGGRGGTGTSGGGRGSNGGGVGKGGDRWRPELAARLPVLGVVTWREREGSRRQLKLQIAISPLRSLEHGKQGPADGDKAGGAAARMELGGPVELRLRKLGQMTTSYREWKVLHRISDGGEGLNVELLHSLLTAQPTGGDSGGRIAVNKLHEAERKERWLRLVQAVSAWQRMDEDQHRVLRQAADMVFHNRTGFALVQGPPVRAISIPLSPPSLT